MTDTKPPSTEALAFADWVLEFLVGYKTWAIEGNRSALAQRIDAFAERRAAEAVEKWMRALVAGEWLPPDQSLIQIAEDKARRAAIEECAQEMIARFGQGSMGIQLRNALRALADKAAAGKGEP